ncbi:MAG: SH3 domain-containing protein [Blautia sp.]|nr:SH3 domain-containing protein [Blautia sp.]
MKKTFSILMKTVFLTALLALSGCGEDERAKEEAELDAVSASLNGTLVRYTGSLLSIKTEEGKTLTFDNCSRAELDLKNGIVPGNEVLLVYVGALKDSDTSKVRIRKIVVEDDNTGLISTDEESTVTGSAASGAVYSDAGYDEPESGVSVEKTHGTGYITGGVNVRSDAKSSSEILGHLGSGDTVTVTGICENGWYRIVFEERTAYIWKDYISYKQ